MLRLACQTITFGEDQRHNFDTVFASVHSAGYEGVEIGFRHLRDHTPDALKKLLSKYQLSLLASHVGGNLFDTAGASNERALIDRVIEYLNQIGTKLLMYSGLRFNDADQFSRDLASLNRAADACAKNGIRLLYHNHDWEFESDANVMNAIVQDSSPNLGLCPDLGWIMKGGGDVLAFLAQNKSRLGAIHFKDFSTRAKQPGTIDTCLLGQGVAPLCEAANWLKKNVNDMWMIAEQDQAQIAPEAAIAANGEFLRSVFHN
jgi:sugar phosphate isomerase/epimerase